MAKSNSKRRTTTPKNRAQASTKKSANLPSGRRQVRIIGGRHKRRQITFNDIDGLRPTPDRLRETLFNWLMPYVHDATVLDACAGSGVLGFEALSRGAHHVTFIEADSKQAKMLTATAQALNLSADDVKIIHGQAEQVTHALPSTILDIVFIDPPYALQLCPLIISQLLKQQLINADTLLYIEDNQPIEQTLQALTCPYTVLKRVSMGQVNGSLIRLDCRGS